MKFEDGTYTDLPGVYYPRILADIKKSSERLQPIYEAFTNSLESIYQKGGNRKKDLITVKHYLKNNLLVEQLEFDKIEIIDTGVGFDDKEFERFNLFKDSRKGFKNKGTGRIQLIHFFETGNYSSIFKDDDGFKKRKFTISKSRHYSQKNNTITYLESTHKLNGKVKTTGTSLLLSNLLEDEDKKHYNFDLDYLKRNVIFHCLMNFCLNRDNLPKIAFERYIDGDLVQSLEITRDDIPINEQTFNFKVNYSLLSENKIKKADDSETFKVTSFKISKDSLHKNGVKLTSKNEIVESNNLDIGLTSISDKDSIDGKRFLFLVSADYLDSRDSDVRGKLKIPSRKDFKKYVGSIINHKEIIIEDIRKEVNHSILSNCKEIQEKVKDRDDRIEELKSMFLLSDDFLQRISVSLNDSEHSILEKVYIEESKQVAKLDTKIKYQFGQLNDLDPSSKNYEKEFNEVVNELVKEIPLQNRKELTRYVARRKIVLELFNMILNRKLKVQNNGIRKKDEALIHNLIFKQQSDKPDASDLWLLDEDFILFDGSSERRLMDLEIKGIKIFKEKKELSEEELSHVDSLNEKRYRKRPDILLFPDEGKCIIIEFKAPDVDVSDYIIQIQNYSTLIRNFSKDEFEFDTFYGYLIGEKISAFNVRSKDPDFKQGHKFDYLFRPLKNVAGSFSKRRDGALYMEIMKYSTLYERAKNRNDIFIKKLTQKFNN